MCIADIVVSKPGGVTTSEVLSLAKPMIIVKPLPGQEANNTAYLTHKEAALEIEKPGKINLIVEELLKNPQRLKHLSDSAKRISKPNASMDIARLLLESCND
jgi:processive 1,2-diacylglycerol beta-glucosyltransferase